MDLLPYNTFKVSAQAANFTVVKSEKDIRQQPVLILGEGANILLTHDVEGLVVKNEILGKKILEENDKELTVEMGSGENWHEFVMWAVENNLSGIENLALIPGTVGAAPVQNIAAYGQNFGETVVSVTGIDEEGKRRTLSYQECKLYYRDSIFKHELKGKFFVTSVVVRLSKTPRFDTNYFGRFAYESLRGELEKIAKPPYTPKQVAQAVINLRTVKMPDWHIIGTAGSFFKNPFVSKKRYEELQKEVSDLQAYPVNAMLYPNPDDPIIKMTDQVKIPAGRLLDKLGWRGKKIGRVGTFEKHALIVINLGGATGQEILDFTNQMRADISSHFAIELEPEVNII